MSKVFSLLPKTDVKINNDAIACCHRLGKVFGIYRYFAISRRPVEENLDGNHNELIGETHDLG
jgi:hypothetical protein